MKTNLYIILFYFISTFNFAQTGNNCLDAIPIEAGLHSLGSIDGDSYALNCTEYSAENGNLEWYSYTSNGDYLITITSCLLYTSPSPRDRTRSRMPSSA